VRQVVGIACVFALAVACAPLPASPPAPAAAARQDHTALRQALAALVAAFEGSAGVWVADPADPDPLYSANADEPIASASLYKLAVLLHAEALVEQRKLDLKDTVPDSGLTYDEALELMITRSDNDSALALWYAFGLAAMNETLRRQGIDGLRLVDDGSDNLATSRAIGTFFARLAQRKLVSAAASDRMLARLERTVQRDRLPAQLPADARVAHKTGDLDAVVHDAGIIVTPIGPRVVVVMTRDAGEDAANALIARIARIVYDASR
jgi:beta-lactamase class A